MVLVLAAEAAYVTRIVQHRGVFDYIGLDYRGTRAAGHLLLEHGLGGPYDYDAQERYQRRIYVEHVSEQARANATFFMVPAPYLPPFSLAFCSTIVLPPVPGYLAWALGHLIFLALYQVRLARAFDIHKPGSLLLAICLSFPMFVHVIMGQISVWLVLFFGEALIHFARGRMFRSGLWLGLLIVKPQSLPLILLALFLARKWHVLAGVLTCWAGIAALNLPFAADWMPGFVDNILRSARSGGTDMAIFASSMMNWRAFAMNATRFLPSGVSWMLAAFGMVVTAIAGLACSKWLRSDRRREWSLAWLAIISANCALVWHSHVHMALLLVPAAYAAMPEWRGVRPAVEVAGLALPLIFVSTAATFSVGLAHDLVGQLLFAFLLLVCGACLHLLFEPTIRTRRSGSD